MSDVKERVTQTTIRVHDVVQIDPEHDPVFGACFLLVTEVRPWGVIGYVQVPGLGDKGGDAYYRVPFEKVAWIGPAEWAKSSDDEIAAIAKAEGR